MVSHVLNDTMKENVPVHFVPNGFSCLDKLLVALTFWFHLKFLFKWVSDFPRNEFIHMLNAHGRRWLLLSHLNFGEKSYVAVSQSLKYIQVLRRRKMLSNSHKYVIEAFLILFWKSSSSKEKNWWQTVYRGGGQYTPNKGRPPTSFSNGHISEEFSW